MGLIMSKVLLEKYDGYAMVILNRPDSMNALSRALREEFVAVFEECQRDESIRVVIVTGNGKAFCAGFDLKELSDPNAGSADQTSDNTIARAMEAFDGPIIGAINGHAVTGGFELALACDVIIASEHARFADTHARVGILPGWGLSQRLPRLIGLSRAKELSLTGRPLFADQALAWGLVNSVCPADELIPNAKAMAQSMCECVPHIMREYNKLIDDGFSMPLNEAMVYEERIAIESAKHAAAELLATRTDGVFVKGRSEKNK